MLQLQYICRALCGFVGTHALVHFQDEDRSSIVPLKCIDKVEELSVGDSCFVTWSDSKKYFVTLLLAGSFVIVM